MSRAGPTQDDAPTGQGERITETTEHQDASTTARPGRKQLYAAAIAELPDPPVTTFVVDDPADAERYTLVTIIDGGTGAATADMERRVRALSAVRGATVIGRLDGVDELAAFKSRDRGVGRA